mgnify:CR=1 FL=1
MRINSLEAYHSAGVRCGKARRHGDETTAQYFHRWLVSALAMETPEYRPIARSEFDKAYIDETTLT